MKILVTGFEPFGGERQNPSAEVIKLLSDVIGGAEIIKLTLPVVRFTCVRAVEQAVEAHRPDVVLAIGQAGGRANLCVERVAVNLDDYRIPDNEGNQPIDEPVVPGGPDGYLCTLPVKQIVAAMQQEGIPAGESLSAGTYVCNHLFYSVSHLLAERCSGARAGFIHIPYLPEQVVDKPNMPSMSLALSARAVEIAIEVIAKEKTR